jgi:hypothetical protein
MTRAALAALALILMPRVVSACATCISSPFSDQSYIWPYLGLILLPFGLIVAIVSILGYLDLKARLGRRGLRSATVSDTQSDSDVVRSIVRRLGGYFGAEDGPQIIKETT